MRAHWLSLNMKSGGEKFEEKKRKAGVKAVQLLLCIIRITMCDWVVTILQKNLYFHRSL